MNQKASETQRFCRIRDFGSLKLGFTNFSVADTDMLDFFSSVGASCARDFLLIHIYCANKRSFVIQYKTIKPTVYVETTVVSYLVARLSTELMEELQMKETPEAYTDPILEECYRMKEEYAAQFKSMQELYEHLKRQEKKRKQQGWKYVSSSPDLNKLNHRQNGDL